MENEHGNETKKTNKRNGKEESSFRKMCTDVLVLEVGSVEAREMFGREFF